MLTTLSPERFNGDIHSSREPHTVGIAPERLRALRGLIIKTRSEGQTEQPELAATTWTAPIEKPGALGGTLLGSGPRSEKTLVVYVSQFVRPELYPTHIDHLEAQGFTNVGVYGPSDAGLSPDGVPQTAIRYSSRNERDLMASQGIRGRYFNLPEGLVQHLG